ncbi:MAG: DNA-directed RNA polymerase subunit omega [Oscillospiraceae bacterium]|nr:DNA-directed RNA polymerase subunit omega [Oscillospiraceae bacterium]
MIYPSIGSLLKKVDSRYTLVIAVAKRARMINGDAESRQMYTNSQAVSMAIGDIDRRRVTYRR